MRDDVKIGILLGFLLILGVFIYWLVISNQNRPDSVRARNRLAGESGEVVADLGPRPVLAQASADSLRPADADRPAGDGPKAEPVPQYNPRRSWASSPKMEMAEVAPAPPAPTLVVSPAPRPTDEPVSTLRVEPAVGPVTPGADGTMTEADGTQLYKVQPGDTPWKLAAKFLHDGTRWPALKAANPGVNWDSLPIGATIKIPAAATTAPAETGHGAPGVAADEYVIEPGDTLSGIAKKKLGKDTLWPKIEEANPGLDATKLHVGKVIKIPRLPAETGGAAPTPPPATPPSETRTPPPATPSGGAEAVPADGYRVKSGDNLWGIAASQLGDGTRWREIFELNKEVMPNKDALKAGMILKLPPKRTAPPAPSSGGGPVSPSAHTDSGLRLERWSRADGLAA